MRYTQNLGVYRRERHPVLEITRVSQCEKRSSPHQQERKEIFTQKISKGIHFNAAIVISKAYFMVTVFHNFPAPSHFLTTVCSEFCDSL